MNKTILSAAVTVAILVAGGAFAVARANKPTDSEAGPPARPVLTVTVAEPVLRELPLTLAANGSVAAWQEAVIGAEVSGLRLAEVKVQVGDAVQKGTVLAVFADETVQAEVAQARASLAEAEASVADARLNAQRASQVAGSGAMSEQQVAQYLTAAKTAEAKLQAAKAQLEAQRLRQRQTRVLASDSGVISSRSATLGAVATPGQELFRLIRQNRLEWRAEVTSADLARLQPGVAAMVTVAGFGELAGTIRTVAPTVDAQSRNALVYVDLPGAAQRGFRPGMFARGEFRLGSSPALSVPQDSLSLRDGFSYVFRLGEQTGDRARVSQIKVEPGRRLNDQVEIVAGVQAGDRLVAAGAAFLADGDSVKIVATGQSGASAAMAERPVPIQAGRVAR
ncbi:MAG: efflux RND transporter periplasmic adaptor subunit [Methylococcaceae bacterium]|nr:efflux RND transporter periplasmic adaptor subunit [Methylococcaceae bacterium]